MIYFVYSTFKDKEEAEKIAKALAQKNLIACANIQLQGITSVYEWKGQAEVDHEVSALFKTTELQLEPLEKEILSLHSYECPCIVWWPLNGGYRPFLDWVKEQTRS